MMSAREREGDRTDKQPNTKESRQKSDYRTFLLNLHVSLIIFSEGRLNFTFIITTLHTLTVEPNITQFEVEALFILCQITETVSSWLFIL